MFFVRERGGVDKRERGGVDKRERGGVDKREKYCDIDNTTQIFRENPFFRPQNDT